MHSQHKSVGHWIKTTHDLQPDSDNCCLACEVELGRRVSSPKHRGTGTSTSFSAIENPLRYISLGGVDDSGPLVTADFMMTVPSGADTPQKESEVLCFFPAGAVVQRDGGEPGKNSSSLLEALEALGFGWGDDRSLGSIPGAFLSDDFDYDMCSFGETGSWFPKPPSVSSESDSEYEEDMSESFCPPPSHQKPEAWTPGRTSLQSPAPPFYRSDMRLGDDSDSDFDEFDCDNVIGPESGQDGGFFKGLQMALPAFLQDVNGDRFWELI